MEQLSQNALVEAEVQRLEAELERGRRQLAAMEAQLAKKRERANLPSRQHTEGEYSKAVAPLPATRDESSSKDEDEDKDAPAAATAMAAIPAAATARAGVPGGFSGTRGIDAASAAAAEIPDQHQLRALCQLGLDASQAHNADEPTPVASRAAPRAGPRFPTKTVAASAAAKEALRLLRAQNLEEKDTKEYTDALQKIVKAYKVAAYQGELTECANILSWCLLRPSAIIFVRPVDTIAYNLTDYNEIVLQPMDYTTIFSKLIGNMYKDGFGFKSDMELVFYNCKRYNTEGTKFFNAADDQEKYFTPFAMKWLPSPGAPQKLANPPPARAAPKPAQKRRRADAGGSGGADGEAVDEDEVRRAAKRTAARAAEVAAIGHAEAARRQKQFRKAAQQQAVRQQRAAPPAAAARPPMTFEQKRQLSVELANLPIARQARVVQIIEHTLESRDDEIELDLNRLDNTTLWRLFDYVFSESAQMQMGINHNELVVGAPSAAPAAAPPPKPTAKPAASSSDDSSSDDSSSDDEDDKPAGELKPKPVAGELKPKPSAHAIIPEAAVRKEVTIQNASSWAIFGAQGAAAAGGTAAPGGNGTAAAGDAAIPDALWSEFARKEAEKERIKQEREREEAEHAAAVAKLKADAEAAGAAASAAAEVAEARRVAEREAARDRARAELMSVDQTVNLDEQRSLMEEMSGGGGAYGGFVMPDFPGMDEPAPTIPRTDEPAPAVPSTDTLPTANYGSWHDVV
jgi:bromodomain-containing factor 1